MALGTVRIPKAVKADGKPLPAGTYQVRLTTDEAKPDAVGTSGKLERWVEFVQRELSRAARSSRSSRSPRSSSSRRMLRRRRAVKVQMLKGNDYLRVWINKGGNHYLVHLPAA